jgi:hypothetical protein
VNKLSFVHVIAFVMLLNGCTPDTAPGVEPKLDDAADGQVQNRGAGTSNLTVSQSL